MKFVRNRRAFYSFSFIVVSPDSKEKRVLIGQWWLASGHVLPGEKKIQKEPCTNEA